MDQTKRNLHCTGARLVKIRAHKMSGAIVKLDCIKRFANYGRRDS